MFSKITQHYSSKYKILKGLSNSVINVVTSEMAIDHIYMVIKKGSGHKGSPKKSMK